MVNGLTPESACQVDKGGYFALMPWKGVVEIGVDSDSIDHDRELSNSPAHDDSSQAEVLLECGADDKESTDEKWNGDIACPVEDEFFKQPMKNSNVTIGDFPLQRRLCSF